MYKIFSMIKNDKNIGDKKAKDMTKEELQAWANSPAYISDI